jgi:valyl-tRNA synthetase
LSATEGITFDSTIKPNLTTDDEKLITELNETLKDVTGDMDNFRFYLAGEKLYHYAWHTFADIIIEASKDKITKGDAETKLSAQWTLLSILETLLRALHPFTPFVTEEIWSDMPIKNKKLLLVEKWPS